MSIISKIRDWLYPAIVEEQVVRKSNPNPKLKPTPKHSYKPYSAETTELSLSVLPYEPIASQIIYVESNYDEEVNAFIQENYHEICALFKHHYYDFCYLPYIANQIRDNYIYYAPQRKNIDNIDISSDYLIKGISAQIKPSLLFYDSELVASDGSNEPICKLMAIDLSQEVSYDFMEILRAIKNDIDKSKAEARARARAKAEAEAEARTEARTEAKAESGVKYSIDSSFLCEFDPCYSLGKKHYRSVEEYVKAEYTDDETERLIREIEERVTRLEQLGIGKHILQQLISSPEEISRMVITRDYRIILPDYNNMEIEMTPLVKAVYFLFLRHPEGIIFKNLDNYRNEFIDIYQQIKGERLNFRMAMSVGRITTPTNNSINEKVARIREAFFTRFDKRLATHYIIHGNRGEAKRIPLNRKLVEWQ